MALLSLSLVWVLQDALSFQSSPCLFQGPCLYPNDKSAFIPFMVRLCRDMKNMVT